MRLHYFLAGGCFAYAFVDFGNGSFGLALADAVVCALNLYCAKLAAPVLGVGREHAP
jgi:hypothetical protein